MCAPAGHSEGEQATEKEAMPRKALQLAKLTRPRLHNAVSRERLFSLLDDARTHKAAIAVVGPPGAGKTTLVASWLDARGISGLWYHVDPGDADLGTFFYYLREASGSLVRKGQRPLPLLTAEYLHDVAGFSRTFFRELFSRMPPGAALVLDNYQEGDFAQPFHQVVASAIEQLPAGYSIVIVSRSVPPNSLSRLIANGDVGSVGWEDLKLTLEETRAIASTKTDITYEEIRQVYNQTDGWVAGLVLVLERPNQNVPVCASESQHRLFAYFASQVWDRVSEETKRLLLATAFLPWVSPPASESLSGCRSGAQILEDLYRRHLFTLRCPGLSPRYQYHALFRDFLLSRIGTDLSDAERTSLRLRSANLLEQEGLIPQAFALYAESGQWNAAAGLALRAAPDLIALGRLQTVVEWMSAIPAAVTDIEPWLAYWHGCALTPLDPAGGRQRLEGAFETFSARSDLVGTIACAAGIIDSIFLENHNLTEMDRSLRAASDILQARFSFPSRQMELRAYSSTLLALTYRQPSESLAPVCAEHVLAMLELETDSDSRVCAGVHLLTYASFTGRFEVVPRLRAVVEPIVPRNDVAPVHAYLWWAWLGYLLLVQGEYDEAERALCAAQELEGTPRFRWEANMMFVRALCAGTRGEISKAVQMFEKIEKDTSRTRRQNVSYLHAARAWKGMFTGDAELAEREAGIACGTAEDSGNLPLTLVWRVPVAWSHARLQRYDECLEVIDRTLHELENTCYKRPHVELLAIRAWVYLQRGEESKARGILADTLRFAKRYGHGAALNRIRPMGPEVCAFALQAGIEADFATSMIRMFMWRAPSPDEESWPWRVKVYTLGSFAVLLDDEPLTFGRKAPRKPISLLKAIIAFGEHGVSEQRLIDALWPDEEGDAARHALALTLHRLRRLLASQDAIKVVDGVLALNHDLVWTDVRAFAALLQRDDLGTEAYGAALIKWYRGSFLAEDVDASWTVSMRERLRSQFLAAVQETAAALTANGRIDTAMALYVRGLDADPLGEVFYQGLMRCYLTRGRHAEAFSTYRRLQQTLSVVLGVQPSQETEALLRELRAH
jgi:DNA-binding SARP family transcriptional activator